MISQLSSLSSTQISDQLYSVFIEVREEIALLAEQAPQNIVESVHLTRKRLKFLRAFVKLTQFCSGNVDYKKINILLRDSGRLISDCRDAHVRSLLLDGFKQSQPSPHFIRLIDELIVLNNVQTEHIEKNLLADKSIFNELLSRLNQKSITNYFSSLDCDTELLLEGYILGYQKSYRAFHSELTSHEADLLHEWRKRTKDLQYQMELLTDSIPNDLPPSFQEVSDLNEVLGRINDLYMFSDWIDERNDSIKKSEEIPAFRRKMNHQLTSLQEQADESGHSLYRFTPEDYRKELKSTLVS